MATKPELLMPAGNIRSFYAALEGGADAVYLGLQEFNARKRANNFTIDQIPVLTSIAEKYKAKIYITLNTVVKNKELPDIYSLLYQLSQTSISAIIIQDWGVFQILKKYFPKLPIHASTQMAFHNSLAANFGKDVGIERVILARELTLKELKQIRNNSSAELELFVHGALCYSFSGLCLFSSYSGGMSANRGACKQPCRWLYNTNNKQKYIFSLKDIELIDIVPELTKIGINSLKIEGRMKSFDYVYTIAQAYRMVIDDASKLDKAKEILKQDIGREKTRYFLGGNISESFTKNPNTGLYTGTVNRTDKKTICFSSEIAPETIKRIRICSPDGTRQNDLTLENINITGNEISSTFENIVVKQNDLVYVIGYSTKSFASRLPSLKGQPPKRPSVSEAQNKTQDLCQSGKAEKPFLWLRINSPEWLPFLNFNEAEKFILNFSSNKWTELLKVKSPFQSFPSKIICGLPKYISENSIVKYKELFASIQKTGIRNFMVSHASQKDILPKGSVFFADENVYTFNDAAIGQLQQFGFSGHISPFENDFQNLFQGKDRTGIVPIYFFPQLFFSRMPIDAEIRKSKISDNNKTGFRIINQHGNTITLPQNPVSIIQSKDELIKKGFRNFLIDLSFVPPSEKTLNRILEAYMQNQTIQPTSTFNFKKGLS